MASLKLDYKAIMRAGTKVPKSLSERPMGDKAFPTQNLAGSYGYNGNGSGRAKDPFQPRAGGVTERRKLIPGAGCSPGILITQACDRGTTSLAGIRCSPPDSRFSAVPAPHCPGLGWRTTDPTPAYLCCHGKSYPLDCGLLLPRGPRDTCRQLFRQSSSSRAAEFSKQMQRGLRLSRRLHGKRRSSS